MINCQEHLVITLKEKQCNKSKASFLKKKLLSTPPKGEPRQRSSWATPERRIARHIFKKYLSPNKTTLPTPQECRNATRQNQELQGRTINQLKGWICSERQRIRRKKL